MPERISKFRRVVVGKKAHLRGNALDDLKMRFLVSRAQSRHRVQHPDALQPHTIRRTLHEIEFLRLACRFPRILDTEKHIRLMEEKALCRVQIFRLGAVHTPRRKPDDPSEMVVDIDYNAVLKQIISTLVEQP